MNMRTCIVSILSSLLLNGCATEPAVSYQLDVNPILEENCLQCHMPPNGTGYMKVGLNMKTYQSLMQGTVYGPVIIPGDSRRSILNKLVEGRAGKFMRMPHNINEPLTEDEIQALKLWVNQGALNN